MEAMVGRAAELTQLARALDDADDGRGRLIAITGPAGIGKSRLAEAATETAKERGLTVARGYAVDDPGAPPLWPWLRALRRCPGVGDLPIGTVGESDAAARFRLLVAISDLIRQWAMPTGAMIVLEDLQWADRGSLLMLEHLAAELADLPLVVVVTGRSGDGGLDAVLPELVRFGSTALLPLDGLETPEVAQLVAESSGGRPDPELARMLHEVTGGNPLLVRLVAADVTTAGGLAGLMTHRPQLRRLVAARVADLGPDVQDVLDAASVLGERIRPDVLAAMTGRPDLAELLDRACRGGILRDTGGLAFEHALVRDAVYEQLPAQRRAELHAASARALVAVDSAPGWIAMHWQRAGDLVECLRWARRARDQALAGFACDDATRYAHLAVNCARDIGEPEAVVAALLVELAEARALDGFIEAAADVCAEAGALAESAGRPELVAAAALVIQGSGHPVVQRAVLRLCRRALELVPEDDRAVRARLTAQLAVCLAESEGGPVPGELAAAALAEAEASEDPAVIFDAIAARHIAICMPDTVAERLELGRRAVSLDVPTRPLAPLLGRLWRLDAAMQLGTTHQIDHELSELDRLARDRGSPLARWHFLRFTAALAALRGDFPAARRADVAANELAARVGDVSLMGMSMAFRLHLAIWRGDTGELVPNWEQLLVRAPAIPLVLVTQPIVSAVEGDLDRARAEFEPFRHVPAEFAHGTRWWGTMTMLGLAAILLDDAEVAAAIYDRVARFTPYYSGDGSGAVFSLGGNGLLLGDLALTAGRTEEAAAQYDAAITMDLRIGARPAAALARLGRARTLLAHGDDLDQAGPLVSAAAAEFRRLDMPGALAAAGDVQHTLEMRRRAPAPLTSREQEVAQLVAQALSNRHIADRLVLSERTVETHVRSILAKLGFTGRTEIATWVARHDFPRAAATRPP